MRQLLIKTQFQMAIRAVVEMPLQIPELLVDVRIRAGAEQHELGVVVAQGVENGVMDEMNALLAVQPAHVSDERLEILA